MSGDVLFPKVALLLHGNSFNDLSYSHAVVHPGPVTLSQAFPGIVANSFWFKNTFSGVTMRVEHPQSAQIDAGEDFTVEITAYCQKNTLGGILFSNRTSDNNPNGLSFGLTPQGKPFVRVIHNGVLVLVLDAKYAVTNNALHTFKFHRASGKWGLSVDGVPQHDLAHQPMYAGAIQHGANIYIGCDPFAASFVGGINQVRMTVGHARQTGYYQPEITPWPIYALEPNILFGSLSNNLTTRNAAVSLYVDIQNAASVAIAAVDGANNPVGSSWAIALAPGVGQNTYHITGFAPSPLADYRLVITGTTTPTYGSLSRSQSYRIFNTQAGSLSVQQNLLASLPGRKLWLDASDLTTIDASGSNVNWILNKFDSMAFSAASGKPKPLMDATAFSLNSIKFIENAACGLEAALPVVISDAESNSVVFLAGRYTGQNLGQANGRFQISYTDSVVPTDDSAAWAMNVTGVGANNASMSVYDSSAIQNGISSNATLVPGQAFVLVWETRSNVAKLWINQRLVAVNEEIGTLGFWESANAAIRFIGGASTPAGAFISIAELIALDAQLNESQLESVMSALNHKWNVYPNVPFSQTPSTLTGYVGNLFTATTILTDTTSVSIVGSAGTGWNIEPSGSSIPGEHVITGILPTTVQTLVLALSLSNNGITAEDTYVVSALALPTTPTILTPLTLRAQAGAGYASLLYVFSADTVSVVGSAGSDWVIAPAPENDAGNFIITGTAPNLIGSFTLTVSATKTDPGTGLVVNASRQFTIEVSANLVLEPDQYPVDLTGLLPSNKISNEAQTLTPANGVKHQLLIPTFAPFFANSLLVHRYTPSGQIAPLQSGVDYVAVLKQSEMSSLCDSPIFSGVNFINPEIRGAVYLTYQTLGGSYSVDHQSMLEELARVSSNARYVAWDAITGKPVYFPVEDHYLNIQDETVGFAGLVSALESLRDSIDFLSEADVVTINSHIQSLLNPHSVTKAQIGLGRVNNYALATEAEAISGTSSQRYLTPKTASLSANANLYQAQDTVAGSYMLNLGLYPGDDVNDTKPLTGLGVVNLLITPVANALNLLFASTINQAEQAAQASPFPLVFPLWWKGHYCVDAKAFASAVRSYTGIMALRFKRPLATFYFPTDVVVPSLVTTQAYDNTGTTLGTVLNPVALPLRMKH